MGGGWWGGGWGGGGGVGGGGAGGGGGGGGVGGGGGGGVFGVVGGGVRVGRGGWGGGGGGGAQCLQLFFLSATLIISSSSLESVGQEACLDQTWNKDVFGRLLCWGDVFGMLCVCVCFSPWHSGQHLPSLRVMLLQVRTGHCFL